MSRDDPALCWCFGASLTEGLTRTETGAMDFRPYAAYLSELSDGRIVGVATGHSGATTDELLEDHLEWDVATVVGGGGGKAPRFVAVLGGTNDLGHGLAYADEDTTDDDIAGIVRRPAKNLMAIAKRIRSHPKLLVQPAPPESTKKVAAVAVAEKGAPPPHVFIITVPPLGEFLRPGIGKARWAIAVKARHCLTARLRQLASQPDLAGGVSIVDSWAAVASGDGDAIRADFDSGDGIHFSDAGYRALAGAVVEAALGNLSS
jgi:lysophospholipase L1-like esterase